MPDFDFRSSIASLEARLSPDAFRKVQVALSLLHYEHGLEVSDKSYLLALTMIIEELEQPSIPPEVARRYGFNQPVSDYDLVQAEMAKGFQLFSLEELEAEMSKISP
jgi:hypothetical protein